ncbi:GNAT family N-acetyltransferase [Agromyces archimandritae]|uniref:GNAT family N-acetyltransferase n=1 Tax=Agromyces archimandritae TaxID=2781962 RepID=A0A975FNR7_9MICO|nr:GNAT family N-acetyltransferase [Agromyces archimandritae]QTX05336.1 GNAT family N-acetyltransferase [Agromyces archimandritae]
MEPVALHTARLVLDQPGAGDVDTIAGLCQDPAFERFLTIPWPYTRDDAAGFVGEFVPGGWASGREATWAIRDETGGPLLGVIGFRTERNEIGFWLGAAHRGRGIMREAALAVADWAFAGGLTGRSGDDVELTWRALRGNLGSAGVARAAGFRRLPDGPVPLRGGGEEPGWVAVRGRHPHPDARASWAGILDA